MTDALLVPAIGAVLVAVVLLPFLARHRKREAASREAEGEALRYGLHEPVTLHPMIDPGRCIVSGSCVDVCPEGDVFGLIDGRVKVIGPARCIGHGLCERSCPVSAIQLVFGTEKRGIEIPRIQGNFETNVPGLYIVGELGGMGLIGNAFEQGRQCVEGIAKEIRGETRGPGDPEVELVIVGCGPAGLSASLAAKQAGLRFLTVESEDVGGTVRHYPRKKLVLTRPVTVPGFGKLSLREVRKEELIETWEEIVARTGLEVATGETVTSVRARSVACATGAGSRGASGDRAGRGFVVATSGREIETRRLVLAIGRRGVPRKLGVPGEDLPKVAYSLREPESYRGDRIVVVGGGDSAVEAALALAEEPGNEVRMSYRGERFRRIKPQNHERVEAALAAGRLEVLWNTTLARIGPDVVEIRNGGEPVTLANDHVFIFAGGELPTSFLRDCGVEIDTKFGAP